MIADLVLDAFLVACVLCIAVGVGLIFVPAGLIAFGFIGGAGTLYYVKGSARDRSPNRPGA